MNGPHIPCTRFGVVGDVVDIGAFEYLPLVVSTDADEENGDFTPDDLSLREALGLADDTVVVFTTDHGHFFGQH